MKLLAVNGSPRKRMNTGSLLERIVRGAAARGADAELVHHTNSIFSTCPAS
jgi:multimeric flavodoxin WrbA